MKQFKHLIIYFSIFCIVTVSIFTLTSKTVYAEVPQSMTAIPHSSSWGGYDFSYSFHKKYWTIQDPTGIPTSQLSSPNYFYKDSNNNTFIVINGADLIQLVLTRGLSVVLNPEIAPAVIQAFFTAIGPPRLDGTRGIFVQGGVYDGQNNFLGYALNDISNCYYEGIQLPADTLLKIPSDTTNNVKNFYDYYNKHNYPDYINVECFSWDFIQSHMTYPGNSTTQPLYQAKFEETFPQYLQDHQNVFHYALTTPSSSVNTSFNQYILNDNASSNTLSFKYVDNVHYINGTSGSYWNNFCEYYELFDGNNDLLSTEVYLNPGSPSNSYIKYYAYDNTTGNVKSSLPSIYYSVGGSSPNYFVNANTSTSNDNYFYLGRYGNILGINYQLPLGKTLTIYKDQATYNSINVTKDYRPDQLIGTNYYNYNTNNDNSITTTIGDIDNSITNNTTIYEGSETTIIDNTTDGQIDQTQVNNDIDIQIEIIYPTPDPDDPINPDDPNNPSDPEDPETILDAILDALRRFFAIIGRLLGTVLAGLLEVIDALLESISGIMENLTGVTDFIGALFSWLPTPVPQVLGVGLSICILAAIIKFIRG